MLLTNQPYDSMRNARRLTNYITFFRVFLVFVLVSGCAPRALQPTEPTAASNDAYPETKSGAEIHDDILAYYGRYDDDALQGYVQRIGEQLAALSEQPEQLYRFTVLDTPDVNAFAVPGGYVYVHRGLLAYLGTEAELAGVLAHEIGHLMARHALTRMQSTPPSNPKDTRSSIARLAFRSASAKRQFNATGEAFLNGFGQEAEMEATHRAAQYLARAGYDPKVLATILGTLRHQHNLETMLAPKDNRTPTSYHVVRAQSQAPHLAFDTVIAAAGVPTARTAYLIKQEEFFEKLDGLTFADSGRFGIRRGNRVFHQELGISLAFPQDWSVQNQRTRWIATAPHGDAFIQASYQDLETALTPEEFVAKRLQLDTKSSGREFKAGTIPGFSVLATVDSPFGLRPSRFYVTVLGTRAFIFVSVAQSDPIHTLYDPIFEQTVGSLHMLSEEEIALAQPLRLKVLSATEGMKYRNLAETSPLRTAIEDQLRVLNRAYPDGEVSPGQLIKIIQ